MDSIGNIKKVDTHNHKDVIIATKGVDAYEKKKERERQRYYENKDKIKERYTKYRSENSEHHKELQRKWRESNPDKVRQYEMNRKEQKKAYNSNRKGNIRQRASSLKGNYTNTDRKKGFETDITIDFIIEKMNDGCLYCGEKDIMKLGLDRIDNTKGHTMDNVVCACAKCNKERRNMPFKMYRFIKMHPNICDDDYEIIMKTA